MMTLDDLRDWVKQNVGSDRLRVATCRSPLAVCLRERHGHWCGDTCSRWASTEMNVNGVVVPVCKTHAQMLARFLRER